MILEIIRNLKKIEERSTGTNATSIEKYDLSHLPEFKYHPDPLGTGAFVIGEDRLCPCCGEKSNVYYFATPYCEDEIDDICPDCISSGKAAEKYDAAFIGYTDTEGIDPEKTEELLKRTPGYPSWQGEHWLSCCDDYCAYLGTVGTKELKNMGIDREVFDDYAAREIYQDIEEYLEKDGSLCGYLFQCLHCGKYHLHVDAD